jgi:hypothetical protein
VALPVAVRAQAVAESWVPAVPAAGLVQLAVRVVGPVALEREPLAGLVRLAPEPVVPVPVPEAGAGPG